MPTPQVLLVAVAAAGLWYGGSKIFHGVKKVAHKVEHVFKPKDKPTS